MIPTKEQIKQGIEHNLATRRTGQTMWRNMLKYIDMNDMQLKFERQAVDEKLANLPKGNAWHLQAYWEDKALKRMGY